jgi:hypothetical protein
MARTKGAINKPKELRQYDQLPDLLTPRQAAEWLRMNRGLLMEQIHQGIIPADCYQRRGTRFLIIKNKLAEHIGIKKAS